MKTAETSFIDRLLIFLEDNLRKSKEEDWHDAKFGTGWIAALMHVKVNFLEIEEEKKQGTIEYEVFLKSEEKDFIKLHGWFPIATDMIRNPEKIEHYIEIGLLRKIQNPKIPNTPTATSPEE